MKQQFSEAIKFSDGIFYNLQYHQTRIDRTIDKFGGEKIDLVSTLGEASGRVDKGLFKCRLVYGVSGVVSVEFIPYSIRHIDSVCVIHNDNIDYSYKYVDRTRLNELLKQSGCDDIIIVKDNLVTDSFAANLVFESSEGLFTPDTYLLSGTKRQYLLDTGIIKERCITISDIKRYDRIRFINAMIDLDDNVFVDCSKVKI